MKISMMYGARWIMPKYGDVREVEHCNGGYRLPDGLEPGTSVKIVGGECGYYHVIAPDGQEYEIFGMCCKHPTEINLDGKWYLETHPVAVEWHKQWERDNPAAVEHLKRYANPYGLEDAAPGNVPKI